jgi:hypothetical protein
LHCRYQLRQHACHIPAYAHPKQRIYDEISLGKQGHYAVLYIRLGLHKRLWELALAAGLPVGILVNLMGTVPDDQRDERTCIVEVASDNETIAAIVAGTNQHHNPPTLGIAQVCQRLLCYSPPGVFHQRFPGCHPVCYRSLL